MEDFKKEDKIEFTPDNAIKEGDISFDFKNFEFDEKEIIVQNDYDCEYEEFMNVDECRELFEEYLDVKKTSINEINSNPLYFLKKLFIFITKKHY